MPGIARRRRQPRSWSAPGRGRCAPRPPRARRARARRRAAPARSKDCSSGGPPARSVAASGGTSTGRSRRRGARAGTRSGAGSPPPRSNTISCSTIAQARALNGSGWRRTAGALGAQRGPDQRVVAEALVERAQVVVDAEGEAHARDRRLGPRPSCARGRRTAPRRARSGRRARARARAVHVDQARAARCRGRARARRAATRSGRRKHQGGSTSSRCSISVAVSHAGGRRPGTTRLETISQHLAAAARWSACAAAAERLARRHGGG